jgi:hypothetical protein
LAAYAHYQGILSPSDAIRAVECGADGISVSNHGGRSLDSAISPIEILPDIADTVGVRTTILLDGGVRRGTDIIKALALGPRAVMVGRATLFATAVGGQNGATKMIDIIIWLMSDVVLCRKLAHKFSRRVLSGRFTPRDKYKIGEKSSKMGSVRFLVRFSVFPYQLAQRC